jgi:hypothetical protein
LLSMERRPMACERRTRSEPLLGEAGILAALLHAAAVQHNAHTLRTPKHEGLYRYGRRCATPTTAPGFFTEKVGDFSKPKYLRAQRTTKLRRTAAPSGAEGAAWRQAQTRRLRPPLGTGATVGFYRIRFVASPKMSATGIVYLQTEILHGLPMHFT